MPSLAFAAVNREREREPVEAEVGVDQPLSLFSDLHITYVSDTHGKERDGEREKSRL